jgi:hypothetical protein
MADTVLPSIATVNDAQLAAMLDTYGDVAGWKQAMIRHILNDIRRKKEADVQAQYAAAVADLNAQEAAALAQIDALLDDLVNP